mgnify:CR=1 FL=1
MIKNIFFFIIFISFSYQLHAGIYKQVDANGNVTYSNVPSSNGKKVDLPAIVVVPSVNSEEIDDRIVKRRESAKIDEHREELQKKISEEISDHAPGIDNVSNKFRLLSQQGIHIVHTDTHRILQVPLLNEEKITIA